MTAVMLDLSMSLDGFVVGPKPREEAPLGEGGERLHDWMFGETADVNEAVAKDLAATTGAVVMGRRMFDLGLAHWGDTPFPVPCFVLTHRAHDDVVMPGGTFTFVTTGLTDALERAKAAAGDRKVLAHSPQVAQQMLRTGLIDELQLHLVPILLGAGTRLFDDVGEATGELALTEVIQAPGVTHLRYRLPR